MTGQPVAHIDVDIVAALTEALVASQDRLYVLRALLRVGDTSLQPRELMRRVMTEALELTGSDAAVVADGGVLLVVGHAELVSVGLRSQVLVEAGSGADADRTAEVRVVPVEDGAAVMTRLGGRGTSPAALALVRGGGPRYSMGDLQLVDAVRAVVERLRELAGLHREALQRVAVQREHELASSLAQAMLPTTPPLLPGVEVFARSEPASLAGGDFMSFVVAHDLLWMAVGDVAGKGLPAAIIMTRAVSATRAAFLATDQRDPAGAMHAVSEELYDYLDSVGLFITAVLASYQPGCGFVQLCNAGHSPVLAVAGDQAVAVAPTAPPLGVVKALQPRTCRVPMPPGTTLVIGSDGLVEQPDADGRLFGYERFVQACVQGGADSVDRLGEQLFNQVRAHAHGTVAADDRTLVLVRARADR